MTKKESHKKGSQPRLVVLNNAFKLAEKWVNEMSGSSKSSEVESEGRPERLGIGSVVPRKSKYLLSSSDVVERKLKAKLETQKRKSLKSTENLVPSAPDSSADEDDSDEESKAESFSRRRVKVSSLPLHAKECRK